MMTQGEMEFKINNLYEIVKNQQEEIIMLNKIIQTMASERTRLQLKSFHRTPGKDKE